MNLKELGYKKISVILILIAVIIRFYLASVHHISGDACWQLSNSRFIAEKLRIPLFEQFGRDEPFWPPPLFHLVSAFVYKIFSAFSVNAAEFTVKMISPIFGSLTFILSFLISRKLFNEKIAFYSLVFLAFIPLSLDYSIYSYIDGMLAFLAVLSVYFALKNKPISTGISAGLAILTKYNGIFILPVLAHVIYSRNKNKKSMLSMIAAVLLITGAIGSIWFIRNWIYLGNPVWPFMDSIFKGIKVKTFTEASVGLIRISNIFDINAVSHIYLGIFGVPDGNINTLHFFPIPYFNTLFGLWMLATIIFSLPLFIGIATKNLKYRTLLLIWILSYILLVLLYVVNASWSVARFLLPAFPAVAFIWAHGMEKITYKTKRKFFVAIIILIGIGFVFTSFVKIILAANAWNNYSYDFEWARLNTNKDSVFLSGSQCISYNINRQTQYPEVSNIAKADYVFVNQDFKLDRRAVISNELLSHIKSKGTLVYRNEKTSTEIYKIK